MVELNGDKLFIGRFDADFGLKTDYFTKPMSAQSWLMQHVLVKLGFKPGKDYDPSSLKSMDKLISNALENGEINGGGYDNLWDESYGKYQEIYRDEDEDSNVINKEFNISIEVVSFEEDGTTEADSFFGKHGEAFKYLEYTPNIVDDDSDDCEDDGIDLDNGSRLLRAQMDVSKLKEAMEKHRTDYTHLSEQNEAMQQKLKSAFESDTTPWEQDDEVSIDLPEPLKKLVKDANAQGKGVRLVALDSDDISSFIKGILSDDK